MGIIEWLNANAGAIIGIAAVVLIGIAGYYASLMSRMLKANNTPEIAISLRPHEVHISLVMLCIENIGTGAARHLRFTANPASISCLDIPFEKIGFLTRGIAYLEPGRKIEQFLVNVIDKYDELKQIPLEITVRYNDPVDHEHEQTFYLNFSENEGISHIDKPPLFEIATATKEIQKDIHNIAVGVHRPIILTGELSEHHWRQRVGVLESQIEHFPKEVQQEIWQEIAVLVRKRDQEAYEKKLREQTATDTKSS